MVSESAESSEALQDEEIPGGLVRTVPAFEVLQFYMEQSGHLRKSPQLDPKGLHPDLSLPHWVF